MAIPNASAITSLALSHFVCPHSESCHQAQDIPFAS